MKSEAKSVEDDGNKAVSIYLGMWVLQVVLGPRPSVGDDSRYNNQCVSSCRGFVTAAINELKILISSVNWGVVSVEDRDTWARSILGSVSISFHGPVPQINVSRKCVCVRVPDVVCLRVDENPAGQQTVYFHLIPAAVQQRLQSPWKSDIVEWGGVHGHGTVVAQIRRLGRVRVVVIVTLSPIKSAGIDPTRCSPVLIRRRSKPSRDKSVRAYSSTVAQSSCLRHIR